MGDHLESERIAQTADLCLQLASVKGLDAPAIGAHQMMVVAGLADHIPMAAVPSVDSIQNPQLGEKIKRAEDGGATDINPMGLNLFPGLLGAKVMVARGEDLDQRLPRPGEPVALLSDAIEDLNGPVIVC